MKVLNKSKDQITPDSVYIGRPSKWGNPYIIGKDGDRKRVIEKYKNYLLSNKELLADLHELKNKDLVCWCRPKSCHGDVLLSLVKQLMREDIVIY